MLALAKYELKGCRGCIKAILDNNLFIAFK